MAKVSGKKCLVYSMEAYQTNHQIMESSEYKIATWIQSIRTFILLLFSPIWVPLYIIGWLGIGIHHLLKGANWVLQSISDWVFQKLSRNKRSGN